MALAATVIAADTPTAVAATELADAAFMPAAWLADMPVAA
jgi:hypothetical protein